MKKPLRVLIIEDSEDDVLLSIHALKKGGYEPEYERVETAEAMRTALQEKTWDVILCDYQLPQFDGLAAIALLKESGVDIPLIIVSGAIGEETASDCMRSGAHDYVMKGNLSRLVPAIERELKDAASRVQRKQAEEALRESHAFYHSLVEQLPAGVFRKDREGRFVFVSPWFCRLKGMKEEEFLGKTPLEVIASEAAKPDANEQGTKYATEGADHHVRIMQNGNPVELVEEYTDAAGRKQFVHALKIPVFNSEGEVIGTQGILFDITERKKTEEQLRESLEQLRRAVETTIQVLVMAVEVKDPYTAGHQRRMTNLARTMATEMGLPPEKIEGLRMAGVIHDIGKITLPTEILSKPTKLSAIEFSLIREHVRLGYDLLKDVESSWPLAEIVLQHHERMDGSGYPLGLKGEEILIEARILAVADVVEAMASHRPYRAALGLDAALEEIEKNRGLLYDSHAVDTCLKVFREKGYQIEGT
jgi:PAS domain S-box-containing protein